MSPDRVVLGRGLDQLLGRTEIESNSSSLENRVLQVPIEHIHPDQKQPRRFFDETALNSLASSIKKEGLLQPILVSKEKDNTYKIIAGERRWRAVQKLGWPRISVLLKKKPNQTDQKMVLALVENLQRQDLNPLEEAHAFQFLLQENAWSQQKLAETVGRDRSSIANTLRLLNLHPEVQKLLSKNKISLSIAKLLLQEKSLEKQVIWAKKAAQRGLTVRDVEKKLHSGLIKNKEVIETPYWLREACAVLSRKWGVLTQVHKSKNKTKIVLSFDKDEDLKEFIHRV